MCIYSRPLPLHPKDISKYEHRIENYCLVCICICVYTISFVQFNSHLCSRSFQICAFEQALIEISVFLNIIFPPLRSSYLLFLFCRDKKEIRLMIFIWKWICLDKTKQQQQKMSKWNIYKCCALKSNGSSPYYMDIYLVWLVYSFSHSFRIWKSSKMEKMSKYYETKWMYICRVACIYVVSFKIHSFCRLYVQFRSHAICVPLRLSGLCRN